MNNEFLKGLTYNREKVVPEALKRLYKGVLEVNGMIGLDTTSESLKELYKALREEEVGEIFKAIDEEDPVEFLDGVIDGLVICSYEYLLNYSRGDLYRLSFSEVGLKTELRLLRSLYRNAEISDVLGLLENIFYIMNIDHDKAVDEVLKSNFSKFPTFNGLASTLASDPLFLELDGGFLGGTESVIEGQIKLIKHKGRYDDITTTLVKDSEGFERIIFWAGIDNEKTNTKLSSPKYIKPCTFVEPDFGSCLRC